MGEIIYKLVKRVVQYFCFPDRPLKGGDILHLQKWGTLSKERVDQEKGAMTPLNNYVNKNIPQQNFLLIQLGESPKSLMLFQKL